MTTKLLPIVNRSLSTAVVLSAIFHCALILAPPSLFPVNEQASSYSTPLIFDVVLRRHPDTTDADDTYAKAPHPDATTTLLEQGSEVTDPSQLAETDSQDPQTEIVLNAGANAPFPIEPISVAASKLVRYAMPPRTSERIQPFPERIVMSRKQQNMMRKKFRKWSNNFYREKSLTPHASWKHGGQEYSATFRRLPGGDDMGIERVVVEISTEEDGKRMSTEMRLKRLAFSNFAQLVDRWDPTVELHNDELDGRFHSNSTIYIGYGRNIKPKFRGKVTTASRGIAVTDPIGRIRRDEVFLAGLETGVKRIRLPRHVTAFVGDTLFGDGEYQHFSDDARITFYPNGTYGWRIVGSSGREEICGLPDKPYYIVAAKKKKLYLKGVVKGRILVYSPERIIIENDLTYAHDPDIDTDGANYLGLVSAKNIEVARPDVTGPGDLVIHAAIYAKRRFVVRRYRAKENATLLIHGSVTAGSLSATEPRYRTRIQFDRRLEDVRPPNFPVTNQYEIESWDPQWTIDGRS